MATIEERANALEAGWRREVEKKTGRTDLMPQTEIGLKLARRAYIDGATQQDAISRAEQIDKDLEEFEKFLNRYFYMNYSQSLAFKKFKKDLKGE